MPDQNAEAKAANPLKSELKRKGVTYAQLIERLADIGITEKEINVANKLFPWEFQRGVFLQCLHVIGSSQLHLD